jgi:hypothetical protein
MSTHQIFRANPITGKVKTSLGEMPTPYHVNDAHAVWIGGTANLASVKAILQNEQVAPLQTASGKALMAFWAVDERLASLGPHTELQFSFYVSAKPMPPVPDEPFALLKALLNNPQVCQMCHGLWNNTPEVVAYNREILGLTAHLNKTEFTRIGGRVKFSFADAEDGSLLARGDVREMARPPMNAMQAMFKSFGLMGTLRAAGAKLVNTRVMNPVNPMLPRNAIAQTFAAYDDAVAQLFDPAHDTLEIAHPLYGELDFHPQFVEHMRGFKMVYLEPGR